MLFLSVGTFSYWLVVGCLFVYKQRKLGVLVKDPQHPVQLRMDIPQLYVLFFFPSNNVARIADRFQIKNRVCVNVGGLSTEVVSDKNTICILHSA